MPAAPTLDLVLNIADPKAHGLMAVLDGRVMAGATRFPQQIRNDVLQLQVRAVQPSTSGIREWDDVDLTGATVLAAIGTPDLPPTAGTFYLTANGVNTSNLSATADAPTLAAALNLLAQIIADGGVTVSLVGSGAYQVTWNNVGARAILGANGGSLAPLSVVTVSRVQTGTASAAEVQLVQLIQVPYCFNVLADLFPSPGATVSQVQIGTTNLPSIQRVALSPLPYDGVFRFTIAGQQKIATWNASAAEMQSLVGTAITVQKQGNGTWLFQWNDNGAQAAITVDDVTNLSVPRGVSGRLALNTMGLYQAFAVTLATRLTLTFEIEIQFPDGTSRTVFQSPVQISRDLVNLSTLVPASIIGLQQTYSALLGAAPFTYTNTITGLRGGTGTLEAVITSNLSLGTRYDILLNGEVETWVLYAGAADGADPNGQVAPLDFNAGTNNKHWAKSGGY
jgi:hypothetical protein